MVLFLIWDRGDILENTEELARHILEFNNYPENELAWTIELVDGAIAMLKGSGAYQPENPLTRTVIIFMVGFWLENRDMTFSDFINPKQFPGTLPDLITKLQYSGHKDTCLVVYDDETTEG